MANTPIEFEYFSGVETLTADLIAADDTVVASGLSATERTNGKGRYTVTYTGSATGHHTLHPKSGSSYLGFVVHVYLADTTDTHYDVRISSGLALPKKGAAFTLPFKMVDSSNTAATGLTVTAKVGKDGGALATCTNSVSELSDGFYKVTLTAAEMSASVVHLLLTATGAQDTALTFTTY